MTTAQAILIAGLGMMAIIMAIGGHVVKSMAIAVGSAFAWLIFAVYSYNIDNSPLNMPYWFFWFGIAMTIAVSLDAALVRRSPKEVDAEEREDKTDGGGRHQSYIDKARSKRGMASRK